MLLVYVLMTATVNSMDGLGLFLYIDIIPFNPHSLTAIHFNRHKQLDMCSVYGLMMVAVNSTDGLWLSFYI